MNESEIPPLGMVLSEAEFNELDEFLSSDEAPEECMDISTLDGFLTALVVGPNTVMPSQWLPLVWNLQAGEELVWESANQAMKILGLIYRYFNTILAEFETDPKSFAPVFYESKMGKKSVMIYDAWCEGIMLAIDFSHEEWLPLIKSEQQSQIFAPLILFGREAGGELMKEYPDLASVPHGEWEEKIRLAVIEIYHYWRPFRTARHTVRQQSLGLKTGRNDPCPCGSGKKFKKCCLN